MPDVLESTANFFRRYNYKGLSDTNGYVIDAVNAITGTRQPTTAGAWAVTSGTEPNTTVMANNGIGYPSSAGYGLPGCCLGRQPSGGGTALYSLDTAAAVGNALTKVLVVRTPMRWASITNYGDAAVAAGTAARMLSLGYRGATQQNRDYVGLQINQDGSPVFRSGQALAGSVMTNADDITLNGGFSLGANREILFLRAGTARTAIQAYRNGALVGQDVAQSPTTVDPLMFDYTSGDDQANNRIPIILDDYAIIKRNISDAECLAIGADLAAQWPISVCNAQCDLICDSIGAGFRTQGGITYAGLLSHWFPEVFWNNQAIAGADAVHWADPAVMNAQIAATVEPGHLITRRKAFFHLGHNAILNAVATATWKAQMLSAFDAWCDRTGGNASDIFVATPATIGWCAVAATRAAQQVSYRAAIIEAAAEFGIPASHVLDLHADAPELGLADGTTKSLGMVSAGLPYQQPPATGATANGGMYLASDGLANPGAPNNKAIGTDLIHGGPIFHCLMAAAMARWGPFAQAAGFARAGAGTPGFSIGIGIGA